MAINIGGVSCRFLSGDVGDLKERIEVWQLPGIDGYGAHLIGKGNSPFVFVATLIDSYANCLTWRDNIEALQGTIVEAEDDFVTTYTDLLVLSVNGWNVTPALTPPSTLNYLVRLVLRGVKTA
jgi:hypothetical protein